MKLTKLKALWLCHELWFWLSKNPDKMKDKWPKWRYNGGKYRASADCFACEFTKGISCIDARKVCILPAFNKYEDGCFDRNSAYDKWLEDIDVVKNSRIISNSSYKEYKRIGGKKAKLK